MFLRNTDAITDRIALANENGMQFSYGELERLSEKYKIQIPSRSLVMIVCDLSIETIAFYYCQMLNHVVPILVDKDLDEELLSTIIKNYEPQYFWFPKKEGNKFQKFTLKLICETEKHLLVRTLFGQAEMYSELALLLTTSGSTGSLKMVRISYENLRNNSKEFAKVLNMHENDRGITAVPIHHCYGMTMMHVHWMAGACVCVTEYSVLNLKFWECFKKMKITNFFGVSYTYSMLKQIGFLNEEYKHLRFMAQAGTKLPDDLQREFGTKLIEKDIKFYMCYGQTEATGCISVLSPEKILNKYGSVGAPIPGVKLSIKDANDEGEGEFVCSGKSITMGYADDKTDLIREDERFGRLYTGDIGFCDEDGDYFIRGRKKRFVKVLEKRISLDELETMLSAYLGEEQVVCSGDDNEIRIYHLQNCSDEIVKFCSQKLSIPKRLIKCFLVEKFPYTSSGKICYADL